MLLQKFEFCMFDGLVCAHSFAQHFILSDISIGVLAAAYAKALKERVNLPSKTYGTLTFDAPRKISRVQLSLFREDCGWSRVSMKTTASSQDFSLKFAARSGEIP